MKKALEFPDSDYFSEETRKKLLNQLLIASEDKLNADEFEFAFNVLVEKKNFYETARRLKIPALNQKAIFNSIIIKLTKTLKNYKSYLDEEIERKNKAQKSEIITIPKAKKRMPIKKFLELDVSQTQLPIKIKKLCAQARIRRVNRLYLTKPDKLLSLPKCGKKSIMDIDEFFLKNGLKWIK